MSFSRMFEEAKAPLFSFEFFPPKNEAGLADLYALVDELAEVQPAFMTCTFRPDGTTQLLTEQIVEYMHQKLKVPAVSHLTCVGQSASQIDAVLDSLKARGIFYVLALRGDPPKGETDFKPHPEGFASAKDLCAHIRARGDFSVAVAGYPEGHQEAVSLDADIDYLKEKVDSGADVIITQLFFEPACYFEFVNKCRAKGIEVPVIPGIMPIREVKQLKRFTTMCGASIPDVVENELKKFEHNPKEVQEYGIRHAIALCEALIEGGAPGIHFYTLNKSAQINRVVGSLLKTEHLSAVPSGSAVLERLEGLTRA